MRLFLMVLIAGVASLAVAQAMIYVATYHVPCSGEGLACTMNGIFGSIVNLVWVPVTMVAFGAAAYHQDRRSLLVTVAAILLVASAGVFGFALWSEYELNGVLNYPVQKLLQFHVPLALTVLVQWLLLHLFFTRKSAQGTA